MTQQNLFQHHLKPSFSLTETGNNDKKMGECLMQYNMCKMCIVVSKVITLRATEKALHIVILHAGLSAFWDVFFFCLVFWL